MTSHNKASFSPKSDHYPQLCKFLKMAYSKSKTQSKISAIIKQKNRIQNLNCDKKIKEVISSGLEKRRKIFDRKLNKNLQNHIFFSQTEENKIKWEQFRVSGKKLYKITLN